MLTPNVELNNTAILITGAAGLIGSNLVTELLKTTENVTIVGLDSVNDYYDVSIKEYRLEKIQALAREKQGSTWTFVRGNIADKTLIEQLFTEYSFDVVVNLAAQAAIK
jgi:nucleoside-diphosphate-sugar epimerase